MLHQRLLKYWISLSSFCAASRVVKVPRFLRFPVLGFFLREYKRNPPALSFLIIFRSSCYLRIGMIFLPLAGKIKAVLVSLDRPMTTDVEIHRTQTIRGRGDALNGLFSFDRRRLMGCTVHWHKQRHRNSGVAVSLLPTPKG